MRGIVNAVGEQATIVASESCSHETIRRELMAHNQVTQHLIDGLAAEIALAAHIMGDTLTSGGTAMFFGNGGGAACAQYWASLLLGRCSRERSGLPGIALTADPVVLTNIGNDYGYHDIFARQVKALASPSDVVIGICANGVSANVLAGVRAAKALGARTIGLTGREGGQLATIADQAIVVPSTETARIQEAHIIIAHVMCRLLEGQLLGVAKQGVDGNLTVAGRGRQAARG